MSTLYPVPTYFGIKGKNVNLSKHLKKSKAHCSLAKKVRAQIPEYSVRDVSDRLNSLQHLLPRTEGCQSEGAAEE